MPCFNMFTTAAPARRQSSSFAGEMAFLRRAVGQTHTERFNRAGHGVGGVHAAT